MSADSSPHWYDPLLSPLMKAWERARAKLRQIDQELEQEDPWGYPIAKEQAKMAWERFLHGNPPGESFRDFQRQCNEIAQRQHQLREQLYPQGPDAPRND